MRSGESGDRFGGGNECCARLVRALKECRIFSISTRGRRGYAEFRFTCLCSLIILPLPDSITSRRIQFDSRMKLCLLISGSDARRCRAAVWRTPARPRQVKRGHVEELN